MSTGTDAETPSEEGTEENQENRRKVVLMRPQYELSSVNSAHVGRVQDRINEALKKRGSDLYVEIHEIYHLNYESVAEKALSSGVCGIAFSDTHSENFSPRELLDRGLAADLSEELQDHPLSTLLPENLLALSRIHGRDVMIPVYNDAVLSYDLLVSKPYAEGFSLDPYSLDLKSGNVYELLNSLAPYLEDARNVDIVCPLFTGNDLIEAAFQERYEFLSEDIPLFAADRKTLSAADPVRNPEYLKLLKLVAKYRELGYIDPDFGTRPGSAARSYAFMLKKSEPGSAALYPDASVLRLPGTAYLQESVRPRGAYVISAAADAETRKACLDFLYELYSIKEIADLYTYGIPGEDYTAGENGKVHVTADRNYAHSAWESTSIVPLTPLVSDPDYYVEDCEERARNAELSQLAGFLFDPEPVREKYDSCIRIYRNRGLFLERGSLGTSDLNSELDTYIKELEDAGYDDVRAEISRQIIQWIREGH